MFIKGYKQTEEHKKKINTPERAKKISISMMGKKNSLGIKHTKHWKIMISKKLKGRYRKDKVGYRAIHNRIEVLFGKPNKCEICKKDDLSGKKIHWANKSGKYLLDKRDWMRLCARCHCINDGTINNLVYRRVED